jgi:hypothetical protein
MTRRAWLLCVTLAAAGGCWPQETLPTVPDGPLAGAPVTPPPTIAHAPATEAVGKRVVEVGQKVLAANPELPIHPAFSAVGNPDPQIFHQDAKVIFVTEGLMSRCTTDAQLAAVLCTELGRMMSQREAVAALRSWRPDREPPVSLAIGGDGRGAFGPADGTDLAMLGKFEERNPGGPAGRPPAPPDPQLLAKTYLTRAGYTLADLESVQPLLREADKHGELEKQFSAAPIRPFVGP